MSGFYNTVTVCLDWKNICLDNKTTSSRWERLSPDDVALIFWKLSGWSPCGGSNHRLRRHHLNKILKSWVHLTLRLYIRDFIIFQALNNSNMKEIKKGSIRLNRQAY